MAAEFSAATYRMFAGAAKKRGQTATQNRFLNQAKKAYENPLPRKAGSGVTSTINGGKRWDYNQGGAQFKTATGKKNPGDSSARGGDIFGTTSVANASTSSRASASSAGNRTQPSSVFYGNAHKMTTPAMRSANATWKSTRKDAGTAFKSGTANLRSSLKAGTITRKQFTEGFRELSGKRQEKVKAGRQQIRKARQDFLKGA